MKRLIFSILIVVMSFTVHSAAGQSVAAMRGKLAAGSDKVTIIEQSDVAESVRAVEARPKRTKVNGYTILILSDNSKEARENAVEAKESFEENFPETKVKMFYESPSFYVTAGNYLTKEEAIIELWRFRAVFPKAITQNKEMDIEDFIIRPEQEQESAEQEQEE